MSKHAKYRWDISESAPTEYVVQIIEGDFTTADGYSKGIPTRVTLANGWGKGRSSIASGPEEMAAPTAMSISWFSFREDTFYRGNFELPTGKIESLLGSPRPKPYTYNEVPGGTFIVGIAPKGYVVVWLTGLGYREVVFTGTAEPVTDIPWEAVFNNPDFTKQEIMATTIQHELDRAKDSPNLENPIYWRQLHEELYNFDIQIEAPYTAYSMVAEFNDQTGGELFSNELELFGKVKRSIPVSFNFDFLFPDRVPVASISITDKDEMYAAFRKLSPDRSTRLRVVITMEGSLLSWKYQPRLRVENDEETIEIKGFRFRPVDGSKMLRHLEDHKHMQQFVNLPDKPASPRHTP